MRGAKMAVAGDAEAASPATEVGAIASTQVLDEATATVVVALAKASADVCSEKREGQATRDAVLTTRT